MVIIPLMKTISRAKEEKDGYHPVNEDQSKSERRGKWSSSQ
ncbi:MULTISPECIES: hypothetical protein [Metabacillus]|nr:hypothetical protein [Metabacillus litoralis]